MVVAEVTSNLKETEDSFIRQKVDVQSFKVKTLDSTEKLAKL